MPTDSLTIIDSLSSANDSLQVILNDHNYLVSQLDTSSVYKFKNVSSNSDTSIIDTIGSTIIQAIGALIVSGISIWFYSDRQKRRHSLIESKKIIFDDRIKIHKTLLASASKFHLYSQHKIQLRCGETVVTYYKFLSHMSEKSEFMEFIKLIMANNFFISLEVRKKALLLNKLLHRFTFDHINKSDEEMIILSSLNKDLFDNRLYSLEKEMLNIFIHHKENFDFVPSGDINDNKIDSEVSAIIQEQANWNCDIENWKEETCKAQDKNIGQNTGK